MPNVKELNDIADQLGRDISTEVGNMHEDDIEQISDQFNKTLSDVLKTFNSTTFDGDGFIKNMSAFDTGKKDDKELIKNILNTIRTDYISADSLNQSELLLRRDLTNICTQMPEMREVVYIIRDAIIECNVATGEVSRTVEFENHSDNVSLENHVKDIEKKHDLLKAIKNFIIPRTLMNGEMYVQVVPYAKLFAELESIHQKKYGGNQRNFNLSTNKSNTRFKESVPVEVMQSFKESVNLYSDQNVKSLMESFSDIGQKDVKADIAVDGINAKVDCIKNEMGSILRNIDVYKGSSILYSEMGEEGFSEFVMNEFKANGHLSHKNISHFSEAIEDSLQRTDNSEFGDVDQDNVSNINNYKDIKGCYVKYLDPLKIVPIRMDRRIIGYYYITTTMDLQTNPTQPNGIVDLTFQHYTRDRNFVDKLANIIIESFDRAILNKNIKLKNEIAEVIMAHKFAEGRLSFIYIPENEVIRFAINEDEKGKGHSVIEPSMFAARNYLILTLYNMIYVLNNNTTRVHYLKSSGLNKNYADQIQRIMRKFQSRRISIDDIYSYNGVLNKIGGMGEMVLPAGKGDMKALETDTIEAVNNPINMDFLTEQRKEAISATGVPSLMTINAIDEADFAKSLEMANARFLSTIGSYKIDFNTDITKLYQVILKWETDCDDDEVLSFRFKFNPAKQSELAIDSQMISDFNTLVELVQSLYYNKEDLEDGKSGNPSPKAIHFKKKLAETYLPQLMLDQIDELVKEVEQEAGKDVTAKIVSEIDINEEDIKQIKQ